MVFNIARETALFETCKIEGLGYHEYREFGVNLTAGEANSLVIGEEVFGLKSLEEQLEDFERCHGLESTARRLEDEWKQERAEKKELAREKAERSSRLLQEINATKELEVA